MKKIVAVWMKPKTGDEFGYADEMRVIESDHPRFVVGSRFDFGFLQAANRDGYSCEILSGTLFPASQKKGKGK